MFDASRTFALPLALFLAACLGHVVLFVFLINWTSGLSLGRRSLHLARRSYGVLILAAPILFGVAFNLDRAIGMEAGVGSAWRAGLAYYGMVCCVVSLIVFPAATIVNRYRRKPLALLGNHTQTIDVAQRLGFKPVGRGKHRLLAHLPRNEVFCVDITEKTVRLPRLPSAWDGLTILHLSDLHFCGVPDMQFFQQVMDVCHELAPDLVAFTGDLVDTEHHHRWIVPVLGRLRWQLAAFAILGNHDYWYEPRVLRRRLRRARFEVLGNGWRQLVVRGEPLIVVGHEGPWFRPAPDLSSCPAGPFRLCLSHTPDNMGWGRQNGIDLMLAGHNHGGQIRFPFIGSVFVPSRYSRRYDRGTFEDPPTVLHVSRGLAGQHPLRYNCRPEVTRLVLTKG